MLAGQEELEEGHSVFGVLGFAEHADALRRVDRPLECALRRKERTRLGQDFRIVFFEVLENAAEIDRHGAASAHVRLHRVGVFPGFAPRRRERIEALVERQGLDRFG